MIPAAAVHSSGLARRMSWLGVSDGRKVLRRPHAPSPDTLLPVGSIVAEATLAAEGPGRQSVVEFADDTGWPRRLHLSLGPQGDALVEHRQGNSTVYGLVRPARRPDPGAELRLTFTWHAPERVGILSLENLDTGLVDQAVLEGPHAMPLHDLAGLFDRQATRLDPSVTALAVSDGIAPVGMDSGFATGTLLDTFAGPRPVQDLHPGDVVQTSAHGMQPIRGVVAVEVPAVGRMAPVRLRAPFFGLTRDLIVAQDHRILVAGADAEYLFGADEVLVQARYLARMSGPEPAMRCAIQRYAQVLLDAHVCLSAGGGWGESLYLGDMADNPVRHATSALADVPARALPRHTCIAGTQLRDYEAVVLVSSMCA